MQFYELPKTVLEMNAQTLNEEMLRRYLLGDVSEEQQEAVEERLLQDDSIFEELLALEDELYFDYRQDRLNERERAAFEQKFLKTAEDKEKAIFAEAFLRATAEFAEEKNALISNSPNWLRSIAAFFDFSNRALQFGFAAIPVLLFLGAIGLFIQNTNKQNLTADLRNNQPQDLPLTSNSLRENNPERSLENEKPQAAPDEEQAQEDETRRPPLEPDIARHKQSAKKVSPPSKPPTQTPPATRSIIATTLSPGLFTRSDGQGFQRVKLSRSAKNVPIRLLLKNESDYKTYRASLKLLDDQIQIWTSADLILQRGDKNKRLSINIPANILRQADYEISLSGTTANGETEDITSYYFSTVKTETKNSEM